MDIHDPHNDPDKGEFLVAPKGLDDPDMEVSKLLTNKPQYINIPEGTESVTLTLHAYPPRLDGNLGDPQAVLECKVEGLTIDMPCRLTHERSADGSRLRLDGPFTYFEAFSSGRVLLTIQPIDVLTLLFAGNSLAKYSNNGKLLRHQRPYEADLLIRRKTHPIEFLEEM
jgi:hypothetical protein